MIPVRAKWILFAIMVIAQLIIGMSMIMVHQEVIVKGKEYKFLVRPVDPNDPLRGKYMTLAFADREVSIDTSEQWENGMPIWIVVGEGEEGFAKPMFIKDKNAKPIDEGWSEDDVYFSGSIRYVNKRRGKAILEYPFDRLYLNEMQAPIAEEVFSEAMRDSSSITYATVSILEGKAVLQDVYINDVNLKEVALSSGGN